MRLAPGMTGQLEGGRSPIPLESVIGEGSVDVPLPAEARAEVHIGHGDVRGAQRSGSRARA